MLNNYQISSDSVSIDCQTTNIISKWLYITICWIAIEFKMQVATINKGHI